MKTLVVIRGPMGAGKTAVSAQLAQLLPRSVRLDGDWCWDMHPFTVTEETKAMVLDNITHLLRNFLRCSEIDFVIFAWVLNDASALGAIQSGLAGCEYDMHLVTLLPDAQTLRAQLSRDIDAGLRAPDVIGRAEAYRKYYDPAAPGTLIPHGETARELAEKIAADLNR